MPSFWVGIMLILLFSLVLAHAKYLNEHPDRKVRVEGNADERGSNEYNLALGQRRAEGVKKLLELGGAKASQIETASYGEEKPKAIGHDETSWSQNRRSDIKY
jgi:peptidoglycan-associated lipoprotein